MQWKLNTSNLGKFQELKRLFNERGYSLDATHIDLKEIEADPISVVVHKASQMNDEVIIEDTSLEVEGAEVGVNIRWLLAHLDQYEGRTAIWTTLLAYRKQNQVFLFKGAVSGKIVKARGEGGFGFDPYFVPEGALLTLAESKPDLLNARALAVQALVEEQSFAIRPVIEEWLGPWQKNDTP